MPFSFPAGTRIRLPGHSQFLVVDDAIERPNGWRFYLDSGDGTLSKHEVLTADVAKIEVLAADAGADASRVLAGLWCGWMRAATINAKATTLASSPLRPYAHQSIAVYERMLPQPCLRFLLADEPGTGKTIMAGLYLREMQRLGLISRALVVAPAHLVSKWQADFERFFGGGLRRITGAAIQEGVLELKHDLWIVSLELAAQNPLVQDAIRPDRAGWGAVVIDEAHRLTPSARNLYRVGKLLAASTPRALLMTATPHRGKEELFRYLMHLVDPQVYDEPGASASNAAPFKPGRLHFLRRMKEDLLDYDGKTPLFKGRFAANENVSLGTVEVGFYNEAQELVTRYFPLSAQTLARMVYGKRAASSLFALCETLKRRKKHMGSALTSAAAQNLDPDDEDPALQDEARVIYETSQSSAAEKADLTGLIARLEKQLVSTTYRASKWPRLIENCLHPNGIAAGNGEQAVVFTEFADTASWLVKELGKAGFSAQRYGGGDSHHKRDETRARFVRREFQVLVSTDAGNEGIDLQSAHVLVNWDIPWSLVRLEQRMGRIHRVGQTRDVQLYNLIALGTREGDVLQVLLQNFVVAANRLGGKVFDSLSVVAEKMNLNWGELLAQTFENKGAQALLTAQSADADLVEQTWQEFQAQEGALKSKVDIAAALGQWRQETLESINPRIVEAFLRRMGKAKLCELSHHALGEGVFQLTFPKAAPTSLGGKKSVNVATSGDALLHANAATSGSSVVALGPSEAAFRELVMQMDAELRFDLLRGALLHDASSETPYDLFLWEMKVEENGAPGASWPLLVRVDEMGAKVVRWETLANLAAPPTPPIVVPEPLCPERQTQAQGAVVAAREARLEARGVALEAWFKDAKGDFERLIDSQLTGLKREARLQTRERLQKATKARLEEFQRVTQIEIGEPHCLGWAHVGAGALPIDPTRSNSEDVAMLFVTKWLQSEGWGVEDVHKENRGYDLLAYKGALSRCVEVKGVWESASSSGISLTGNEILIAAQQAGHYWLYIVEECQNGKGELFAALPDPLSLFQDSMKDISLFKVPGSALSKAKKGSESV